MLRSFLIVVVFVVATTASLGFLINFQMSQRVVAEERSDVALRIATLRANIEKEIIHNLSLISGTATFISITPNMTQREFSLYAHGILERDNLLKNLGAAPNFVMAFVYPPRVIEASSVWITAIFPINGLK